MKHTAPQDSWLITYHDESGDIIGQQVIKTSIDEAIHLSNTAIRIDQNFFKWRFLDPLPKFSDLEIDL